jgi:hypothetical protein
VTVAAIRYTARSGRVLQALVGKACVGGTGGVCDNERGYDVRCGHSANADQRCLFRSASRRELRRRGWERIIAWRRYRLLEASSAAA